MADNKNPIPFNTELMTIGQTKRALEVLSLIFDGAERLGETDPSNVVFNIKAWRDDLARDMGAA